MRNIIIMLLLLFFQSFDMSAQIDYTQLIGDDTTDFFSYGESSTRVGFRIGSGNIIENNQISDSKRYNSIEFELLEKLINGIDFTCGFQFMRNDTSSFNSSGTLLSVGLSIYPFRDFIISPFGNFSIGNYGARMAAGVTIPLYFVKGFIDARYEKFVTGSPIHLAGISAGMNIEL